jgi:hypothetical protein
MSGMSLIGALREGLECPEQYDLSPDASVLGVARAIVASEQKRVEVQFLCCEDSYDSIDVPLVAREVETLLRTVASACGFVTNCLVIEQVPSDQGGGFLKLKILSQKIVVHHATVLQDVQTKLTKFAQRSRRLSSDLEMLAGSLVY